MCVKVRLKHLESLHSTLSSLTGADPFADVGKKYREALRPGDREALGAFVAALRDQELDARIEALCDVLKKLVVDNLRDVGATTASLSAATSIFENLGYVELE